VDFKIGDTIESVSDRGSDIVIGGRYVITQDSDAANQRVYFKDDGGWDSVRRAKDYKLVKRASAPTYKRVLAGTEEDEPPLEVLEDPCGPADSLEGIKTGDFIRAIDANVSSGCLSEGRIYKVVEYNSGLVVKITDDNGAHSNWSTDRFTPVASVNGKTYGDVKIGDMVRVIDAGDSGDRLTADKLYRVVSIANTSFGVVDNHGRNSSWFMHRFLPTDEPNQLELEQKAKEEQTKRVIGWGSWA
jgi:hypothetical protein